MLFCREVVFTLWTFVIVGLLANLPCADLPFQQKTSKLCRLRKQTAHESPQQWKQDTHIKCPLKTDRKFSLYKARTLGEEGGTKSQSLDWGPKNAENSTLDTIILQTSPFLPFKNVVGHCWLCLKFIILVPLTPNVGSSAKRSLKHCSFWYATHLLKHLNPLT